MAAIRHFSLPEPVGRKLESLLADCPDRRLVEWVGPLLPGGFTKAKLIRQRLATMIQGSAELPRWLVTFLAEHLPLRASLAALTPAALKEIIEPLAVLLGPAHLAVLLLVDEREEVHQTGIQQARQEKRETTDPEKNHARQTLATFAETTWRGLQEMSRTPAIQKPLAVTASSGEPDVAEQAQPSDALRKLRAELREEKRQHRLKLQEAQATASETRQALERKVNKLKQETQRWREESRALASQLEQTAAERETAIATGVRAQTSAEIRKWLADAMELESFKLQQTGPQADLLARAERALELQSRQDRHTGNRLELEGRLNHLRDVRQQLSVAARTALSPLPELKTVLADLESEIATIEQKLPGQETTDDFTERLLRQINHAPDSEALRTMGDLLESLARHELTRPADQRLLYQTLQRRLSILTDRSAPPEVPDRARHWSLGSVLRQNRPALVLVDGYNVLFRLPEIFEVDFEAGRPGGNARQHLISLVQKLAGNRPKVQVNVCFDGPITESLPVSPNVRVEFSGGAGKNRADEVIAGHLKFADHQPRERSIFVVSDDTAVRQSALQHRAHYVPVDLFAALLAEFDCLR